MTKTMFGWRWDCWACRTRTWDPRVPMTYRVSRETLQARERAHNAIDKLWESQPGMSDEEITKLLARSKVYRLLAEALGLPEEQVHLSVATKEVANRIADAAPRLKEKLDQRTPKEIRADFKERGREIRDTMLREQSVNGGEATNGGSHMS